jgi:hypothetical protein
MTYLLFMLYYYLLSILIYLFSCAYSMSVMIRHRSTTSTVKKMVRVIFVGKLILIEGFLLLSFF